MPYSRAMDLTFVGWIVVGLIAGIISGIIAGGRTLRGWMPSLVIGLIAAGIPGARFVTLPGRNHLFLENEPAFGQFLEHTRTFLAT